MSDITPYANSVFEQPWWLNIVAPGKWGETFVNDGKEVIGRFVYVLERDKIRMPPLTQTLGPWIKREYRDFSKGNSQFSKQKEIITELLAQLPKHRSFNMVFDSSNSYILPYRWLGYRFQPTFSYRISNLTNLEVLRQGFSKSKQRDIKLAARRVHLKDKPTSSDLAKLIEETYKVQRRKSPQSASMLCNILESVIQHGNGVILIASDEHNDHAGAFLLYDENTCYYLLSGHNPEYNSSCAQALIVWEAISYASTVSKNFDFEGSMIQGIESFFREFGGSQIINYSVTKQSFLEDCWEMAKPRIKKLIGYKI